MSENWLDMTTVGEKTPFTTRSLMGDLDYLGIIDEEYITKSHITMESGGMLCIRMEEQVVIIDMAKTVVRELRIEADSAIVNPNSPILSPILAYKVEATIDGTTQDQLSIYDVGAKTTLMSYNMAEKVEYWKWITPKLLALVTLKTIYHWSIEDMTEPVKMSDMPEELATYDVAEVVDYIHDPSEKWLALIANDYNRPSNGQICLFVRPNLIGHPWFSMEGHAAAFTNINVEGNDAPSTVLCFATLLDANYIKLSVWDTLGQTAGFGKKQSEVVASWYPYPIAVQISRKYGLIYVITEIGQLFVHDLETAKSICSYKIDNTLIIRTSEGPSGSIYSINTDGQVLLTEVNDSAIMSFISDKLLLTRGELHDLQKLYMETSNENEGLKKHNTQLQNEKNSIVTNLERSIHQEIRKREETEEQLSTMRIKMLNDIEELNIENTKLQEEREEIATEIMKSLEVEKGLRREIEEQLTSKINELYKFQKSQEEMLNEMEGLKVQNADLTVERDKTVRNLEEFRLWIKGLDSSTNHDLEANFTEFTHAYLMEVTNGFSDSLKIGEGGYGPVYKAFLGLKPVAIKILRNESHHGNRQFNQELEILSKVKHRNLVMLLGACRETQALVYELMPNGSLYDILRDEQRSSVLTWKTRIRIASDVCSALIFLHSIKPQGVVHGDIKSANILLDSNYTGKLSDFGICHHLQQTDTRSTAFYCTDSLKGTFSYMDPEYISTGEMTFQSDVYSFGIVLLELVTGRDSVGLRKWAEDALQTGTIFVDASAGDWPLEEAKKMVQLGLRCSNLSRKNRPNLEKEVLVEIVSMRHASVRF